MWPMLHMLYSSTAGSSRGSAALLAHAGSLQPTIAGFSRHLITLPCGLHSACAPDLQQQLRKTSSQGSHHDTPQAKLLQIYVHHKRHAAVKQPDPTSSEDCAFHTQAACSKHIPSDARQAILQLPAHLPHQQAHCMPSVAGSTHAHTQVCSPASDKPDPSQPFAQLHDHQQERWQMVNHHYRQHSKAGLSWMQPLCTHTWHGLLQHNRHAPQYQQQHHWQQQRHHQQQQHYHRHNHHEIKSVGLKHQGSTVGSSADSLHQQLQDSSSPHDTQQTKHPSGQQADAVAGSALTTLPNLLSLSRVATSPLLAYSIATHQWPLAIGLTAAAGASDWLDGYMARRLKHTSKLGSYLDPLADKVFIASAVGTMGYMGMLPTWLAVAVVGRDSVQVVGMFWYRLRMFGGVWPGASAFFNVDGEVAPVSTAAASSSSSGMATGSTSHSNAPAGNQPDKMQHDTANTAAGAHQQVAAGGLPMIRPLLISKANTALVMALVAGCMAHQWLGVPDAGTLHSLELVAASTTLASAAAYAHLHWAGRLLIDQQNKVDGAQ